MAAISWSSVTDFDAKLAAVSAGAQAAILAYVNDTLGVDAYGGEGASKLTLARIYLAAHMGEIVMRSGIGGAVTGETVGADSISFSYTAPIKGAIESLETTSWGLEFQRLTNSSARARMPVTW